MMRFETHRSTQLHSLVDLATALDQNVFIEEMVFFGGQVAHIQMTHVRNMAATAAASAPLANASAANLSVWVCR